MTCASEETEQSPVCRRKRSSVPPGPNWDSNSGPAAESSGKKAKIEVTLSTSEAGQLPQIQSEFEILKSLIPNIADRKQINEVRINKP